MKFLTTITTSIILLSPFAANAYDAEKEFKDCVKSAFESHALELKVLCLEPNVCTPNQKNNYDNLKEVYSNHDNIVSQLQMGYDASTIFLWGGEIGLNEENTIEIIGWSVDKCGITF